MILVYLLGLYLFIGLVLAIATIKAGFEMDGINGESISIAVIAFFGLILFWPALLYLAW